MDLYSNLIQVKNVDSVKLPIFCQWLLKLNYVWYNRCVYAHTRYNRYTYAYTLLISLIFKITLHPKDILNLINNLLHLFNVASLNFIHDLGETNDSIYMYIHKFMPSNSMNEIWKFDIDIAYLRKVLSIFGEQRNRYSSTLMIQTSATPISTSSTLNLIKLYYYI